MDIRKLTTKQLVTELKTRAGVDVVEVAPHGESIEIAVWNDAGKYRHDQIKTGPRIILDVED